MKAFTDWIDEVGGAEKVAKRLGCSAIAVRKWRQGTRKPRPEMAERIESASGGSVPRVSWYWADVS